MRAGLLKRDSAKRRGGERKAGKERRGREGRGEEKSTEMVIRWREDVRGMSVPSHCHFNILLLKHISIESVVHLQQPD